MVKGPIPSLQTWEERQGLSPPRFTSPPSGGGLKRSRPVTSGVRSPAQVSHLLGHTEKEVIIQSRAEFRQLNADQAPPPPPPPLKVSPASRFPVNGSSPGSVHQVSNGTISSNSNGTSACTGTADGVETESLDSFTLEHPAAAPPKPPSTYFDGAPAKKKEVMVSISAYGENKSPPARFRFLGDKKREQEPDDVDNSRFEQVTTQLQHELVETLSRANLRHRTGSVDNLLSAGDSAASSRRTVTDKYGSAFNVSDAGAPGGGILKHGQ